jgi:hypothetical protein
LEEAIAGNRRVDSFKFREATDGVPFAVSRLAGAKQNFRVFEFKSKKQVMQVLLVWSREKQCVGG